MSAIYPLMSLNQLILTSCHACVLSDAIGLVSVIKAGILIHCDISAQYRYAAHTMSTGAC